MFQIRLFWKTIWFNDFAKIYFCCSISVSLDYVIMMELGIFSDSGTLSLRFSLHSLMLCWLSSTSWPIGHHVHQLLYNFQQGQPHLHCYLKDSSPMRAHHCLENFLSEDYHLLLLSTNSFHTIHLVVNHY